MPLLSLSSQFYGFEAFSQIETITSSSSKVSSEHYFVEVLGNPFFFFNSIFSENGYLHFASKMRIALKFWQTSSSEYRNKFLFQL